MTDRLRRARKPRLVADPATRPSSVQTSFWLFLATSLATLVLNAIGLVHNAGAVQQESGVLHRQGMSTGDARTAVVVTLVVVVVVTLLYCGLLALFAIRMRDGHRGARVVVTALSAVTVFGLLSVDAVALVIAVFAIVFAFLPASNAWFRSASTAAR